MATHTFLLEIGTEEIPSRFVPAALEQLEAEFRKALESWRLEFGAVRTMGTPRRMAILAEGVAEAQPDREVVRQGPARQACFDADGNPTKALTGFVTAQGASLDDVTFVATDKGERATLTIQEKGKTASEVLTEVLPKVVLAPVFPKTMRWAHRKVRYARPIRWLVALLDGGVVPFAIEDIESGRTSAGHRFLGAKRIEVPTAADYVETMREQKVLVDPEERREEIRRQVLAVAEEIGGAPRSLDAVLDEVLYLVEWPTAFAGSFDESFLELPDVVPTTVLRKHQKYFPVSDAAGKLMARFIAVRNGDASGIENVRRGNEIVVNGRLRDGVFFFQNDVKRPLSERVADLDRVVFMYGLGSLREKTARLEKLAARTAEQLGFDEETTRVAVRAAHLCKADLTTNLVIEFTELQGVLGGVYAARSGEAAGVSEAIAEHYRPVSAEDGLPETLAGSALAIADKIDTVAGVLAIGEEPTGTADPHGVRRRLQGVAAMLLHGALPIDALDLARESLALYAKGGDDALAALERLLRQRAEAALEQAGLDLETRKAVLSVPLERLGQTLAVATAIAGLDAAEPDVLTDAWRASTRPSNIAAKRESDSTEVNAALFEDPAEQAMLAAVERMERAVAAFDAALEAAPLAGRLPAARDAAETALRAFAAEAVTVDAYFEAVMVMADDAAVRNNRLALCYRAYVAITKVAGLHHLNRM